MTLRFTSTPPLPKDFIRLRAGEGWGEISKEVARAALASGLINICAHKDNELAGFGRVIGDGVLYFYVQDLIVAPPFRAQGLGTELIRRLLAEIKIHAASGATIGLMAARDKEGFYERFGFTARPNKAYGAGMIQVLP